MAHELAASQRSLTARLLVLLGGQSPGRLERPSPPPLGRLAAPLPGSRTKNGALGGAYAHGVGGDERPCAAQMGAGAGAH